MAFTGTPVVKALGPNIVRITNAVIGAGASAVIGLNGDSGADLQLPASFPSAAPIGFTMADLVEIRFQETTAGGGVANHLHYTQDNGPPFRITLANDTANPATLEIYIQYFHSMIR